MGHATPCALGVMIRFVIEMAFHRTSPDAGKTKNLRLQDQMATQEVQGERQRKWKHNEKGGGSV